jgi:2-dehydropantoate 2-reductase
VLVHYCLWSGYNKKKPPIRSRNDALLELPSVGIVGAGAIGTITGLWLARITPVVLVGRKTLVTTVQDNHYQLRYLDKSRKGAPLQVFAVRVSNSLPTTQLQPDTSVTVTENWNDLIGCAVIIVATKSTATQAVAERLAQVLPRDCNVTILSFQNGIGNAQLLRTALQHHPHVQVLSSMVNFNASWEWGTNLFIKNTPGSINIEKPPSKSIHSRRVQTLVAAMAANNLSAKVVSNVTADLHTKLLINLFNAVNALAGVSTPRTLQKAGYRRVWAAAMREGLAIYRARGISTSYFQGIVSPAIFPWLLELPVPDSVLGFVLQRALKHSDTSQSSMLQDFVRRRTPTEVNYLCGEIVRLGKEINMKAPVNEALVRLVQAAELANKGSPQMTAEVLLIQVGMVNQTVSVTG